jgi:hypothetical protein
VGRFHLGEVKNNFGIERSEVKRHFQKGADHLDKALPNGRPSILSDEEHEDLIRTISEAYQMRRPMSIGEIRYYIETRFQKSIERNTLWHMLCRDTRIKSSRGVPTEKPRLDVPIEAILTFFQQAIQITKGVPAHFVFNMDEMGYQDWAGRTEKACFVPSSHLDKHVYMPISRTGRRITLMASIAADSSVLKPEIIIPRKTVDVDLLLTGLTDEKLTIRSQPHSFVDTLLFDLWFETTFPPKLALCRTKYSYNGPAVFFLDQCSAHMGQRFQELCRVNHVVPCYFLPHTSNQL